MQVNEYSIQNLHVVRDPTSCLKPLNWTLMVRRFLFDEMMRSMGRVLCSSKDGRKP